MRMENCKFVIWRDNDSRLRRLAVCVLGGPIAGATLGFEEGAVPLLVLSSVSGIAIVVCFFLMASPLYSIDLPHFDNHNIYYLFRHRQVEYRKRITFPNKAVTHELCSYFVFVLRKEQKARRWVSVYEDVLRGGVGGERPAGKWLQI